VRITVTNEDRDLLFASLEQDGMQETLDLLQEECGELVQAVSKYRRYKDTQAFNGMVEESVDVLILLKKFELIVDYLDRMSVFDDLLTSKLRRIRRMMDDKRIGNTNSDNALSRTDGIYGLSAPHARAKGIRS